MATERRNVAGESGDLANGTWGTMINWEFLIDERLLASVIPAEYAHFTRPIRDALRVFLQGLPDQHQRTILAEQAALSPVASISQRLAVLARSCPVLHKLGQIIARDGRLSAELRTHLRDLESAPPTVPLDVIEHTLADELGPLAERGIELTPPAIAEASVAVVIPFRQRRANGETRDGVFKILKPGICRRLEQQLALMASVGAYLDARCEELQIPQLAYQESFQQVREKLAFEVRLDDEQRNLRRAQKVFARQPQVVIPELFDCCTPRVTAMQRIYGVKVTDHSIAAAKGRRRLAKLVGRALIAQPIFSRDRAALFHSDPHAGNLMLTDDGRLAILDWSLVGTLDERQRVALVQIILAAIALDAPRIVSILCGLAEHRDADLGALRSVVDEGLRRIRRGQLPGMRWLTRLLDEAVQTARLRFAADLMLFRKSLHTLAGVIADVAADPFDLDAVMFSSFAGNFAVEWPRRWFAAPQSRAFATRLSNWDLARTMLDGPAATVRFWLASGWDLAEACCPLRTLRPDGSGPG